jgi:hypothetical protein
MHVPASVHVVLRTPTQMILTIMCENGDELTFDIGGPGNNQPLTLCEIFGNHIGGPNVRAVCSVKQESIVASC